MQVNLIYDSVGTLATPQRVLRARSPTRGIQVLEFNPVNPLTAKARLGRQPARPPQAARSSTAGSRSSAASTSAASIRAARSAAALEARHRRQRSPGATPTSVEGPVVAEFQKLFLETWEKQKGEPLAGGDYFPAAAAARQAKWCAPSAARPTTPYSLIYATLISAHRRGRDRASTSPTPTSCPTRSCWQALKDAAGARRRRQADPARRAPTRGWCSMPGARYYDELLAAGVKIYERRDALLHVKTAVIDGVWSTVGSTNLDWRSFLHNHEVNAVVLGTEFGDADAGDVRARPRRLATRSRSKPGRPARLDLRVKEMARPASGSTGCDGTATALRRVRLVRHVALALLARGASPAAGARCRPARSPRPTARRSCAPARVAATSSHNEFQRPLVLDSTAGARAPA